MVISIHAPLAGCDKKNDKKAGEIFISIHAPLAGCDLHAVLDRINSLQFQSTHPLRGATRLTKFKVVKRRISIHAPLAGCDYAKLISDITENNFNPRTPCGVRLMIFYQKTIDILFQSTHPLRGATGREYWNGIYCKISIHAPLAGCDFMLDEMDASIPDFNPRTPCGVRLAGEQDKRAIMRISIHAPLAGCDSQEYASCPFSRNFNPRTPCGVRLGAIYSDKGALRFQSTHPLRGATRRNQEIL